MKIFLGYPVEHSEDAIEVYEFLKSLGTEVWMDKRALRGGDVWDEERKRAQDTADLVIHLCSPVILKRRGVVNREIKHTLRLYEDQPFGALFALFLRHQDFKMPVELLRFHYIDYFSEGWREELRRSVEKRRAQLEGQGELTPMVEKVEETQEEKYTRVEVTDEDYECQGEYIQYRDQGLYWNFVNAEIASHVLSRFYVSALSPSIESRPIRMAPNSRTGAGK
jgi:hypothetical protein